MKILNAKSVLIQPIDRNYNKKGLSRKIHLEVKNDGVSYALRTGGQTLVLVTLENKEKKNE